MNPIVRTPAKLNLGLEIIRKRPDGYHDLATVFQAIDLYDAFHLSAADTFAYVGDPRIPPDVDLARPLLEEAAATQGWSGTLRLTKRIPIAAGLGGGSSDAALALKLAKRSSTPAELRARARSIGADVPFFLDGGTALAQGIGDELKPLPAIPLVFVIVTPVVEIPNKTATLFSGLTPEDYSSGETVRAFAVDMEKRDDSGSAWADESWVVDRLTSLPNSFQRQMLEYPPVRSAWDELEAIAGRAALSGTGPTIYSWHTTREEADEVAAKLQTDGRIVHIARGILPNRSYDEERHIRTLLTCLREKDLPAAT